LVISGVKSAGSMVGWHLGALVGVANELVAPEAIVEVVSAALVPPREPQALSATSDAQSDDQAGHSFHRSPVRVAEIVTLAR
jgi:hypothetical protein